MDNTLGKRLHMKSGRVTLSLGDSLKAYLRTLIGGRTHNGLAEYGHL